MQRRITGTGLETLAGPRKGNTQNNDAAVNTIAGHIIAIRQQKCSPEQLSELSDPPPSHPPPSDMPPP